MEQPPAALGLQPGEGHRQCGASPWPDLKEEGRAHPGHFPKGVGPHTMAFVCRTPTPPWELMWWWGGRWPRHLVPSRSSAAWLFFAWPWEAVALQLRAGRWREAGHLQPLLTCWGAAGRGLQTRGRSSGGAQGRATCLLCLRDISCSLISDLHRYPVQVVTWGVAPVAQGDLLSLPHASAPHISTFRPERLPARSRGLRAW